MSSLVKVQNLSLTIPHHKKLLENVSFDLKEGQSIALMGESGQGKTTLAHALMGLTMSSVSVEGSIFLFNRKLSDLSEKEKSKIRGKEIAMIFQDPAVSLNPFFKIKFQLKEVLKIHTTLNKKEIDLKLHKSLEEVGLKRKEYFLNAYPHQLSGGEKQRILIAMALLCDPKVLIADEPTASLDLIVKVEILKLIKNLQEKRGLSLFIITHDPYIARKMADQIYEIKNGRAEIQQSSDTPLAHSF